MSPPPRYSLLATRLLLVAKTDPEIPRRQDDPAVHRDQLVPADDFRERHAQDVGRPGHHAGAEVLRGQGAHRGGAESEREQAIEGGGRAPALEVAEHQAPRLLAGPPLALVRHLLRNPAEPLPRAGAAPPARAAPACRRGPPGAAPAPAAWAAPLRPPPRWRSAGRAAPAPGSSRTPCRCRTGFRESG